MEDLKIGKNKYKKIEDKDFDENDENELPDIIPAGELPPEGTPVPKLEIEKPQNPEDKKPPQMEKLMINKGY